MDTGEHNGAQQGTGERAGKVRDLVQQFARTLLSHRLYAPSNQLRQEMFRELVRRFEDVLASYPTLVLDIDSDRILWQDEPVLEFSEQDNAFGFWLYKDGARHLIFSEGLDDEEIARFLEIFQSGTPGGERSNVVDALWEADLRHITHVTVDGFTELLEDEAVAEAAEGAWSEEAGRSGGLASRFQQLLSSLVGEPSAPWPAMPRSDEVLSEMIPVHERVASPLRAIISESSLFEEDLVLWRERVREETERELLVRLEELAFYMLEDPAIEVSEEELVGLFGRILREWVSRTCFGTAAETLTRLRQVQFDIPHLAGLSADVACQALPDTVRELVTTGDRSPSGGWDALEAVAFVERFCPPDEEYLVGLLDLELSEEGQRLVAFLVTPRMSQNPSGWATHCERLPASTAIICLANLAAQSPSRSDTLPLFWKACEHPDASVRAAAVEYFPPVSDARFRDFLLGELKSEDLTVRLATIERLGSWTNASVGPFLVNHLRHVGLASLEEREANALARSILRLGGDRYVPALRGQLEKLGWLRQSVVHREGKEGPQTRAVLEALAASALPAAVELVRDVRNRARGEFKQWCDRLWRESLAQWSRSGGFAAATPSVPAEELEPSPFERAHPAGPMQLPPEGDATDVVEQEPGSQAPPGPPDSGSWMLPPEADEDDLLEEGPEVIIRSGPAVAVQDRSEAETERPPPGEDPDEAD